LAYIAAMNEAGIATHIVTISQKGHHMKRHALLGFVLLSFALYAAAAYAGPDATGPAPANQGSNKAAPTKKTVTPYAQLKTLAPAIRKPLTSINEFENYFQNAPVHPKQANPAAWNAMNKAAQTRANAKWVASIKKICNPRVFANKAFDWNILSLQSMTGTSLDTRTGALIAHKTFSTRLHEKRGCYITLDPPAGLAWKVGRLRGKLVRVNRTLRSIRIEHRLVKGKFVPHLTLGTQDLFITPATGPNAKRDANTGIPLNSKYVPQPQRVSENTKKPGRLSDHKGPYDVIYLVDRSGSTLNIFGLIRNDLFRSIGRLDSSQQFRVIFFSDGKTPETIPAEGKFLAATREGKLAAVKKLGHIRSGGQMEGLPAIREAFSGMKGGKKYLLFLITDGAFPDHKKVLELLAQKNRNKRVKINTFLYSDGTPDPKARKKASKDLKEIADLYGGNYKCIAPK
jgi:hypothetical protein